MKISRNMIWAFIFLATAIFYYLIYYLPFKFSQIAGDGICQVAYWYSLCDHVLRGSTCAAITKPGWSVVLGLCHEFYRTFNQSDLLLRLVTSFSFASLVWIITKTSTRIGGWPAGVCSFLSSFLNPVFFKWYTEAQSYLFFLPCIMFGLWFYAKGKEKIGGFLLILSIFFRIESALVVFLLCIFEFTKSHHKKGLLLGAALAAAVLLWACFIYIVQGDLSRLDCGTAAGYNILYKNENFLNIPVSTKYYLESWQQYFKNMRLELFLLPFMIFSIVALKEMRIYLFIFGLFIVYFLNILLLGGTNQVACLMILRPFGIALGFGGFFYLLKRILKNQRIHNKLVMLLMVVFLAAIINHLSHGGVINDLRVLSYKDKSQDIAALPVNPFIINAADIINRRLIPEKSGILTEDDIIYSLIVNGPKNYFGHMTSLPYFNVCTEQERAAILIRTDFIYISKLKHITFFLIYSDLVNWEKDKFREKIINLIKTGEPFKMYSVTFLLTEESAYGFLIKVEHNGY